MEAVLYQTEPGVQVLVPTQMPSGPVRGEVVLVHGLEGSSESGYAQSMAFAALERGYAVHRFNMRGCGGTESLSLMSYHAGQTSDLLHVVQERRRLSGGPVFLVGYSLGANGGLKLAGGVGEGAKGLIGGGTAGGGPLHLAGGGGGLWG